MARLAESVHAELDRRLAAVDAELRRRYPGPGTGRQPVHTVYVPADRVGADVVARWGAQALASVDRHGPLPFPDRVVERVLAKLAGEPVEDLRVDFEDGYGHRDDAEEDADARSAASYLRRLALPFCGLRCKSLEGPTRRRALRTLDIFLDALGPPPDGFVITLPKVSAVAQVEAMAVLCARLEEAYALAAGRLRVELQVETAPAVLGPDGTATVARMLDAAGGRCRGLHFGTYDYTAACGVAAAYQSLAHPAADHAKAVMQVAAAGTGVWLSDGSTNVLPVGTTGAVRSAWRLHARLVRRGLARGFYQGWDLHPGQLPTRFGATYAFFGRGLPAAAARLSAYLDRADSTILDGALQDDALQDVAAVLDEPATARALAGFLRRGLDCGALATEDDPVLARLADLNLERPR